MFKRKMRGFLTLLIFFISFHLFAQDKDIVEFNNENEFCKEIENLIKSEKNNIEERIAEGPIEIVDSLGNSIGRGGFSTHYYKNLATDKLIKIKYEQTIHYKYEDINQEVGNTELLEVNIYYKNDQPHYGKYAESHYNASEIISSSETSLNLDLIFTDLYYTNSFQKEVANYILNLNKRLVE